ncbi:hypothetical protein [Pectobacterium zantedeschiae]|uniref:hypothetical protein n=1 Tax=Pectobacterium zantedeschiae TaxID=2034769 RepID=UPI00101CDA5E|nr:hypothetical protein [Pectobacterium zantedeschiae]RYC40382.1 hypothetical protein DEH81_15780 [Pectobacterium zantedeschiae]
MALVYVPVDMMFNSSIVDFGYQFIWEVGRVDNDVYATTPNVPLIFMELIVIAAVSVFLGRLFDSLIAKLKPE